MSFVSEMVGELKDQKADVVAAYPGVSAKTRQHFGKEAFAVVL